MRFYFALLVLLVTLPFPTLNAQCVPSVNSVQYERFSSVTEVKTLENKPSALLAGIELVLEEKSDRVSATTKARLRHSRPDSKASFERPTTGVAT